MSTRERIVRLWAAVTDTGDGQALPPPFVVVFPNVSAREARARDLHVAMVCNPVGAMGWGLDEASALEALLANVTLRAQIHRDRIDEVLREA